jgi:SPP1 gp7 family putative phage head morphogenesis protein
MAVVLMNKINPQYQKQIEQIKIDGENYTDDKMKDVYKQQKSELDKLHTIISLLFLKYSTDGLLKINGSLKSKVMAEINSKLKSIGKDLGTAEVNKVTGILNKVYEDTYYKNAFVMDEGMDINLKFDLLKKEFVDAAVNTKFKGELFSDRIWKNKADMIDKLKKSIEDSMKGNTTVDKIARDIKNTFNVQAYESQRLVRTEMARVQTQASLDIAKNTGVKEVMWSATLDMKTAPEDASLDGRMWAIDEEHPEPPLHPNCRCVLISVPFADWRPTQRKDNESKDIIDYKTYDQWAKQKNIDDNVLNEKSGKDFDSKVKWDIIEVKKYKNKFAGIGSNDNVDNEIYKTATRILRHRDGSKYEDLYVLDLNSGKTITYTTQDTEMGIKRTGKLAEILSREGSNYAIIHNHPHSSTFSNSDLKTLFNSKSVRKMLAIGHDGTVYTISSKKLAINIESEYKMRYTKIKKYGFSDDTAMEKAIEVISKLYGLGYERR